MIQLYVCIHLIAIIHMMGKKLSDHPFQQQRCVMLCTQKDGCCNNDSSVLCLLYKNNAIFGLKTPLIVLMASGPSLSVMRLLNAGGVEAKSVHHLSEMLAI